MERLCSDYGSGKVDILFLRRGVLVLAVLPLDFVVPRQRMIGSDVAPGVSFGENILVFSEDGRSGIHATHFKSLTT
jgi:hypothetical protein